MKRGVRKEKRAAGFTLIELMIVVAIIAILAAIAIPVLLRGRIASNETSAIGSLRTLCTAQAQIQTAAVIDQDGDGTGEFGFMAELAGATPVRVGGGVGTPAVPAFLPSIFGLSASTGGGFASKSGYVLRIYLPTDTGPAMADPGAPMPPGDPLNGTEQESRYVCYAWPSTRTGSGNRVFIINAIGTIYGSQNDAPGQLYTSTTRVPAPEAGLSTLGTDPPNLDADIAGSGALPSGDGGLWMPVGN